LESISDASTESEELVVGIIASVDVVASTRGSDLGLLSLVADLPDGGGATSLLALKEASHLALTFALTSARSLSLRTVVSSTGAETYHTNR